MVASSNLADPNDFLARCGRLVQPQPSAPAARPRTTGAASPETLAAHNAAELAHVQMLAAGAPAAEVRAAARKAASAWRICSRLRRLVPRPKSQGKTPWIRVTFEVEGLPFYLTLDERGAWQAAGGKDTMPVLGALFRWAARSWSPRDVRYAAHNTPAEASLAAAQDAATFLGGTLKVLASVK